MGSILGFYQNKKKIKSSQVFHIGPLNMQKKKISTRREEAGTAADSSEQVTPTTRTQRSICDSCQLSPK